MESYYAMLRERQANKPSSMTPNHKVPLSTKNNNLKLSGVRPAQHRSFSQVMRNEGRRLASKAKQGLKGDFGYRTDRSQALLRRLQKYETPGTKPSRYQ